VVDAAHREVGERALMSHALVIPLSLSAAVAFALSFYLKHSSAQRVPRTPGNGFATVCQFVAQTVIDPIWLIGILADAVGLVLQIVALRLGALSVVQPLLISTLIFALLLKHWLSQRVARRDFGLALIISVSLAGFLLLAGTAARQAASAADRGPAVIAATIGVGLAATCVVLGRRTSDGGRAAALLGVAAGSIHAGTAALLKELSTIGSNGLPALLTSWELYALLGAGTAGLLISQLAFQAGPLTASLPAIATVDPLASIAIGAVVFDEPIRHGLLAGAGISALLVTLGLAIIQLARDPLVAG
jgi:hypothetical protein